ncbi:hypothetical protein [Nocardioides sp. URHA0020]|uniref:hypothetical protein n=1 Tax=Nocardioides sp. URHA0020 TaxID=1380392 RepID=UPI0012DD1AA8|nr:hypothetical protein [Nocardioides sp. URHA0020]
MSEKQKAASVLLVLAALAFGLGIWWISDGSLGLGICWLVIALGTLASWYVRRRPGNAPWVGAVGALGGRSLTPTSQVTSASAAKRALGDARSCRDPHSHADERAVWPVGRIKIG